MKVRAGRCGKAELLRVRCKLRGLLRLVTAGDDFDRRPAEFPKFSEQLAHLCIVERVTPGMRDHRDAAAVLDPVHSVTKARPLVRHEGRLSAAEITIER